MSLVRLIEVMMGNWFLIGRKMVRESREKFGQEIKKDWSVGGIGESHNESGSVYEMRHYTTVSEINILGI